MDDQSRATLDAILAQEPAALSESDKAFLRARRSYLNAEQVDRFAEVLADAEPEETKESSPVEDQADEAPKKAPRKAKAE